MPYILWVERVQRCVANCPDWASISAKGDQQIFELCVATERSRLLYRILASLLQGILLGLLLATFFMEMEMMLGLTAPPKEVGRNPVIKLWVFICFFCAGFGAGVVSLKLVGRHKCSRPAVSFCSKCAVENFCCLLFEDLNYQVHFCKWSSKPFTFTLVFAATDVKLCTPLSLAALPSQKTTVTCHSWMGSILPALRAHLNTQSTLSPLRGLTLAVAEGCLAMNILRACEGWQSCLELNELT